MLWKAARTRGQNKVRPNIGTKPVEQGFCMTLEQVLSKPSIKKQITGPQIIQKVPRHLFTSKAVALWIFEKDPLKQIHFDQVKSTD